MRHVPIGAWAVVFAAAATLAVDVPGYGEIVDGIVAVVGDEAILQSDVMKDIGPQLVELQRRAGSRQEFESRADDLFDAALQQAIDTKVLLREAALFGVEVREDEVEARLESIRDMYPSKEAFMQELDRMGETVAELRQRIREQRMAQIVARSKRNQFEKEIVISEADVRQYFEEHRDEFSKPERVRVRQIFLLAEPGEAGRARARDRLEDIRRQIQAGADFAESAAAYSEAPGAEEGGIIGWVQRGDLVPELEEAVFALEQGEMSPVLDTRGGATLLMVEEREAAEEVSLDEVRPVIEPRLRAEAAEERYWRWLDELRKRNRVEVYL